MDKLAQALAAMKQRQMTHNIDPRYAEAEKLKRQVFIGGDDYQPGLPDFHAFAQQGAEGYLSGLRGADREGNELLNIERLANLLPMAGEGAALIPVKAPMGALASALGNLKVGRRTSADDGAIKNTSKALAEKPDALPENSNPDPTDFNNVLDLKTMEMGLKPENRRQPSGENPLFDTSAASYQDKKFMPPQHELPVPRAPEGKALPKNDRARSLVDNMDAVADIIAEKAKPGLGTPAQYFYHTGPIKKKMIDIGLPEKEVDKWLEDFAQYWAATSPRTQTQPNLLNSTMAMAKDKLGIPLSPPRNSAGGAGLNEKGYPMIIGEGGIHGQLLERVRTGKGIDHNTNTKPATFGANTAGNLQGVTVDTHAIRGALLALNEVSPGSIAKGFISPKHQAEYAKDPASFKSSWLEDTLGSQMIDGTKMQTEYAVFSDLYKKVAERLNVSPAEAQSLAWFGSGDETNLGSELKTVVQLLDDRIDVTSQMTGWSKEDVLRKLVNRTIPLASLMTGAYVGTNGLAEALADGDTR